MKSEYKKKIVVSKKLSLEGKKTLTLSLKRLFQHGGPCDNVEL